MFDKAKYINSEGKEILFGEKKVFINENDIRDYKWDYLEDNGKITSLSRGIIRKTMPIIIACETETEGIQIKNELFELFDVDVVKEMMGKIVINEYYLPCYIIESKKSKYLYSNGYMELTATLLTDFGYWCRDYEQTFYAVPKEIEYVDKEYEIEDIFEASGTVPAFPFDFPFDFWVRKKKNIGKKPMFEFPFDFKQSFNMKKFVNSHYADCEFKLYIFGACLNPAIFINSHLYEVKTSLSDGDYLVIDSRKRTITKIGNNGNTTNCFNYRNKGSNIFQKIPRGNVSIRWSATFTFKLVILQERSEPPWR